MSLEFLLRAVCIKTNMLQIVNITLHLDKQQDHCGHDILNMNKWELMYKDYPGLKMTWSRKELAKVRLVPIRKRSATVWTLMFWTLMENAPATFLPPQDTNQPSTMATNDQIKTALLTEHFRYTPLVSLALLSPCLDQPLTRQQDTPRRHHQHRQRTRLSSRGRNRNRITQCA